MARAALSTSDNPYNPFTQYELWRDYDANICGYFTDEYLARIAGPTPDDSGPNIERDTEDAIDEIIRMNLPLYSPVTDTRAHYVKVYEQ